ncbi:MAG: restriction endonuclease [Deltaproteobacteria bacterium]|nr:restriction endonuclease [Deltaproteobacteria bacterium]
MTAKGRTSVRKARQRKVEEATQILKALGFAPRQSNEVAAYSLLALLNLKPEQPWNDVGAPLVGITPLIQFVSKTYGVRYAPNTRETIRDEAVKYFVEAGMVLRNPDDPTRPPNSGNTVYQIEPHALKLLRIFDSPKWEATLRSYLLTRDHIRRELERGRISARIPVKLPSGETITISPGGQNPLIKAVVEEFCPIFVPDGTILYIGDAEDKFLHLDREYLQRLGVVAPAPAKMPDVIAHDIRRNWLVLIEAVTSAGPVDGKRRKELKDLFAGCRAGLVFVTAFTSRTAMRTFLHQISWESEVWLAENPEHLIHFDGERFLGPYPDVLPNHGLD